MTSRREFLTYTGAGALVATVAPKCCGRIYYIRCNHDSSIRATQCRPTLYSGPNPQ